uniref:Anaphase-promoting complex subunit 1 n=1 Tax=Mesocestoides corti TaxID=53468 RepID=A0A5K3F5I9_MESCO
MTADFPCMQFPDWWDIHTQKGNHLTKLPNTRVAFGNGRAMVADWGRVGSCQIALADSSVSVHAEISCDLVGSLHFSGCPKPVLPINYHLSEGTEYTPFTHFTECLSRKLGITQLLNDPVFGRQACAAFACTKIMMFLKRNFPNSTSADKGSNHKRVSSNRTLNFLKFLDEFTSKALSANCRPEILRLALEKMTNFTDYERDNGRTRADKSCISLHSSSNKRKEKSPLTQVLASIFRIPFSEDEAKLVTTHLGLGDTINFNHQPDPTKLSELSCAVDPFLIILSARRVNPDFLGHGCLRIVGVESPKMFWAPPIPRSATSPSIPCIYAAPLSVDTSFPLSQNSFCAIQLPTEFVESSVCEIDAVQLDESSFYVIARSTSGQVFTGRTKYTLSKSDNLEVISSEAFPFESPTGYRPISMAISPWRSRSAKPSAKSLSWALAGRRYDPVAFPGSHLAVVEVYDARRNQRSWCGQIPLNSDGECISHVLSNSVAASSVEYVEGRCAEFEATKPSYANSFLHNSLLNYSEQVRRKRTSSSFLSPEQILRQGELDFQISHASTWVRVGYGDAPGLLSLTTPKRFLLIDTRISGACAAQELLNISKTVVGLDKGRLFNPSECIFHSQPTWYGDVYATLATDYNGLVVDKRMPGHPVLHWSHCLRGPLTYSEFCDFGVQPNDFPAQLPNCLGKYQSQASISM